ncbi:competence/damage-inducible protein A [Roseiterribacter gracilis]|uniref:Molybdenum cofactor biosynthesis protein n=1 Tax=Roseiterribacter gracilis TaxID=2812848 RepID=A0A8S8XJK9_9PROT|nr:molybdenum cofactor biosynthesis protein [Rhodospirillales bacterium TMPK1]
MSETLVQAAILVIGNEILTGRTKDANLPFLAERLEARGIRLAEARVVRDVEDEIIAALDALRGRYDYVFTSGGIGPTHDDLTAAAVARAFGRKLVRDAEAVRRLTVHYGGEEHLTPPRLKMTDIPEGASLIDNPVSAAPGFRVENVFVLAGVPKILQAMYDQLEPSLLGGAPRDKRTVRTALFESRIAEPLAAIAETYAAVEIGSYPWFRLGQGGVALVLRSADAAALTQATDAVIAMCRAQGDEPVAE